VSRRVAAEFVGTLLLLAAVVGSGIMGERLSGGNVGLALLANTLATGGALVALILAFGPVSGAHFNPAVTLADASQGGLRWAEVPAYLAAQIAGAFAGVALADGMFGEPIFAASRHARGGFAMMLSEATATFGLLAVIWGVARRRAAAVPFRGGGVHHGGLLVHSFDQLRESGGDAGARGHRHVRGHPARRRAGVHRGAAHRRGSRDGALSLAFAAAAGT
jgi:glycerol uptake facilitator-like aquaporin